MSNLDPHTPPLPGEPNERKSRNVGNFVLTKGIPIPPAAMRGTVYPFEQMEVGESFLIACEEDKKKTLVGNINSAISRFRQDPEHRKYKFHVSPKVQGGVRCWRMADVEKQ